MGVYTTCSHMSRIFLAGGRAQYYLMTTLSWFVKGGTETNTGHLALFFFLAGLSGLCALSLAFTPYRLAELPQYQPGYTDEK